MVNGRPRIDEAGSDTPRWRVWLESRYLLGVGYVLAAVLTAGAVFLASSAPGTGPLGPASRTVLIILSANLVLILALAGLVGWRVFKLFAAKARDAGARLHLRFVTLFALVAVVPAVVVAFFFGLLVNQGVESWFTKRVSTVVENSAKVARSYYNGQISSMQHDVELMSGDLNTAAPGISQAPIKYGQFLALQASYHSFPAAYVIDRDGRILARAEVDEPPPYRAPPAKTIAGADAGELRIGAMESADLLRAVFRLRAYPDAYLYVVRPVDSGIFSYLRQAEGAVTEYRDTAQNRKRIQIDFALSYLETALLVLVGAVWLGMSAANTISAPVGRLVTAADRVAAGDLPARVETRDDPEEIAVLTRAFNRMTYDLQTQQEELRAASADAESRRQFIETVLAGVSAGVVGLDSNGRISAANRQAAALLGLDGPVYGLSLAEAAPEFVAVAARAAETGADAEEEVDLVRDREMRRLRVRASGHSSDGLVLTFDDITRLITAQRNAAWRDVARRIAHEIKNPLTPIQLSAERLRRRYRKDIQTDVETFDRCTDTIIRQVGDIGRMVDEFSSFARMPAPTFAECDAAEMLRQAVFAQRVAVPEVAFDIVEPLPEMRIVCDSGMIGQALTNVLKNAGEAVEARRAADPGVQGRVAAALVVDDGGLRYEIEDNGVGLPAKERHRLTEPYVTTREKGTGLGLAIVKRILEDHGGGLTLQDAATPPGARAILRIPTVRHEDGAAAGRDSEETARAAVEG